MHVNQIELIAAIMKHLDRKGIKHAAPRQYNDVIKAADIIVATFAKEPVMARPSMGIAAWLDSDDTGMSSMYLLHKTTNSTRLPSCDAAHPRDPDDFGRCVRMLDAVPGARGNLAVMRTCGPIWIALVDHWDELESLYREEYPTGRAPKLMARMGDLGC